MKHLFFIIFGLMLFGCKDKSSEELEKKLIVKINHTWGTSPFTLKKSFINQCLDTVEATTLIYHINSIEFLNKNNIWQNTGNEYFMMDLSNSNQEISLNINAYKDQGIKGIRFTIGIADSMVNATGSINSKFVSPMFWPMEGYIFYKFEANCSTSPSKALTYHIGGYKGPIKNYRQVSILFDKDYEFSKFINTLTINSDISKLFNATKQICAMEVFNIHSPIPESQEIANNISQSWSFIGYNQ